MNWKLFAAGAGLAALTGLLEYAKTLPEPYGAFASGVLVLVAHLAPSSLKGRDK
jgi:hypothetical protein